MNTRFFTITDARFFIGTVALLNSIRLTGHDGELVVLDRGLTERQRERLSEHAIIFELPGEMEDPYLVKPFPALMPFDGIVVLIDSDIVVTDTLDPILAKAASGKICVFPEPPGDYWRWFPEWEEIFELTAPLRRQPYQNAGFLAASTAHWPNLFQRWWDACCALIPLRGSSVLEFRHSPVREIPFSQLDQDALNAILMSEVAADEVEMLPPYEFDLRRVVIEDSESLVCVSGRYRRRQPLLHRYAMPKVWQPDGWKMVGPDAYVRLLPRLLFSEDLPLRLAPDCVPLWLRPGRLPELIGNVLGPVADCYRPFPLAAVRARRAPKRLAREFKRRFA